MTVIRDMLRHTADGEALVWRGRPVSYGELEQRLDEQSEQLTRSGVRPGSVVSLAGDFSPNGVALLLALIERACIVVPMLRGIRDEVRAERWAIAGVECHFQLGDGDEVSGRAVGEALDHDLYDIVRGRQCPGLALFTSGSSGKPKAAVHDLAKLLQKFSVNRPPLRILNFLLFDHWGGLNTMFHALGSGGTIITVEDRNPAAVCRLISAHRAEVLPASPSFLNLLLLGKEHERHDLSSLRVISYGTEPMPASTLRRLHEAFPSVRLQQTYGLIEVGVLRSKSRSSDSLWMKVGGEGYETRVVDGLLEIKADSAMLGYLNAPSPFTEDGWFQTGDAVEVDGEFLRVLGRRSELINVGGEKVYPQEVEDCLLGIHNVAEATVYGEANALLGTVVCADVRLTAEEDEKQAIRRIKRECNGRLEPFKVPVKIRCTSGALHGERFKKLRSRN